MAAVKIPVEFISDEVFAPFGRIYRGVPQPNDDLEAMVARQGGRIMLPAHVTIDLGGRQTSFGFCVEPREELRLRKIETHVLDIEEGLWAVNKHCILVVGPPTLDRDIPLDQIIGQLRAFLVPAGTIVVIKPHVLHYVPFLPSAGLLVFILCPEIFEDKSLSIEWPIREEDGRPELEMPALAIPW